MKDIIYKLDIPECSNYTFEVGEKGVIRIEEDIIQTGTADGYNPSKLIYRVVFDNNDTIEISASVSGIIIYKRKSEK